MKNIFRLILIVFVCSIANAQNTWTQKANFGGTSRSDAVGFSIGTKGYIGTGFDGTGYVQDFWEYDQGTDAWTQKANFSGAGRASAVGFSIGTKGYIGTGWNGVSYYQDFWEWDQASNVWTQKANFGGTGRLGSVGFSIGSKGYIGTGYDGALKQDFWEWNQSTNLWTQKANFGGTARDSAVGFSIDTNGYIGTGWDGAYKNDFWEYDRIANTWTQKANFGGSARSRAACFVIGSKGYIGTGWDGVFPKQDLWEWNQWSNVWVQKANLGATIRSRAVGFAIGSKGYIGTGWDNGTTRKDLLEYTSGVGGTITVSTSSSPTSCSANTGTAYANASGGNPPYGYLWMPGGQTTQMATGLGSGTYTVTVTDAIALSQTQTATVIGSTVAFFTVYPDTSTPHHWFALNQATGILPITFFWSWGDGNADTTTSATISHTYSTAGFFNICLTTVDSAGCTSTHCDSSTYLYKLTNAVISVDVVTALPAGVLDPAAIDNAINIFPNPNNGRFQVRNSGVKFQSFGIFNLLGECVLQDILDPERPIWEFDVRSQQNGIYFLQFVARDAIAVKRIVIQK